MLEVTESPILPEILISRVKKEAYGAVVTYVGIVREEYSEGKRIRYLEFDANKEEVKKGLRKIADEIGDRWELEDVAICHRVGRLEVGEIVLVIAVAAPHRREAFEACQYAVDRFKQMVSNREVWEEI